MKKLEFEREEKRPKSIIIISRKKIQEENCKYKRKGNRGLIQ
jgi:hypothetical protein